MLYRDQGVVLRSIKLGETDRIVTVLSQGHGKVRAVAKGVRKPGSRFGARLEPTSHVAFQCYRGRSELDVVTQVETIDANRALREHYGCLTHAVSMLEATDQVAQDREPNAPLYRMLAGALRTLAAEPSALVSAAFFWKLLALEGFHPLLDACARCGNESGRSRPSICWRAACSARRAGASPDGVSRLNPWRCSAGSWVASCGVRSPRHRAPPRSTSSGSPSPPSSTTSNVGCAAARSCRSSERCTATRGDRSDGGAQVARQERTATGRVSRLVVSDA